MRTRLIPFLLCSVCLHLALLWLLRDHTPVEHGMAPGRHAQGMRQALAVRIAGADGRQAAREAPDASAVIPQRPAASTAAKAIPDSLPRDEASPGTPEYWPQGRLTRRAAPLGEIRLDLADGGDFAFRGALELTLHIDANGVVTDIVSPAETEDARRFADYVASRFRSARFSPGEIDGRPVPSQLRIVVVNEDIAAEPPLQGQNQDRFPAVQ
jgi:hypothetical protein